MTLIMGDGMETPWYDYVFCFLGGAFLANFVPHFARGITGMKFPTPFAKPPGRGMSPAPVNVLWALINIVIGYFLLMFGAFSFGNWPILLVAFVAFAAMSVMLSRVFAQAMEARS